jgi:mannan endo-1,4-beta-mannosidase
METGRTGRKWLLAWFAVVLAVSVIVAPPKAAQAAGDNLLPNPGFESGDSNWEKWGSPVVTTAVKHSGSSSLQVKRNTGGASKSVAVQTGKTYRVGLWVKFAASGISGHNISLDIFGTQQGKENLTFRSTADWEYKELLYTAQAGVQYIRLSFWNNTASDYYIDDAVIEEYADLEPPSKPGAWQAEHYSGGLKLTWSGSADNSGMDGYQIRYKKTGGEAWQTVHMPHEEGRTGYSYELAGLDSYSVYAITLTALDKAGNTSDAVLGLEAVPGPNLVVNPGLETGSVVPWEVWKSLETTTDNPLSGQYALRVKNLTGGGTAKMNATANTPYLVSFWTRFTSQPVSRTELTYSLFGAAETRIPVYVDVTAGWTRKEQQFRSGGSDKLMRLSMWNTMNTDMFMDDVFVGAMPELPAVLNPAPPTGAAANGADGVSAAIQWDAAQGGPFGVSAYSVAYRKAGTAQWESVSVPAAAGQARYRFKLEGLSPLTSYELELKTVSEGGLLSAGVPLQVATTAMLPVTPGASTAAVALLNRLYSTTGSGIFTGQHNYYEDPSNWYNKAAAISGYYPALWGSDFAYYTGGDFAALRQRMVNTAITKAQSGAMITLTYHQTRPFDQRTAGWDSVTADVTEAQIRDIVTPGTALYDQWAAQTDEIAAYLGQLKEAGVPVLWRPYHEMNAEFFWWGGRPELFKQLWRNMYDRFTNLHHLDNLIWVWSPNAESAWAYDSEPYYPGHDYVDVLAMDIYNNDYKNAYYEKLLKLSGGRPIAIGENGELPDPEILRENQPRYVYFMTWTEYLTDKNSAAAIQALYRDSRAINNGTAGGGS